ncbi:MAG TPA: SET domain-containing protein-lysine N-methyltransferase, partial [Paraburkholderia sp.]
MSERRIVVRQSGVHGKGVFAAVPIATGERLIEYKGERIS